VLRLFRALQLMRVYADFEAREGAREGAACSATAAARGSGSSDGGGGGSRKAAAATRPGGGASGGGAGEDAGEAALRRYRFTETRVGQKLSGAPGWGGAGCLETGAAPLG
jgi:hypothetical protein